MKKQIICTLLTIVTIFIGMKDVSAVIGTAQWDGSHYDTGIYWRATGDNTGTSGIYTDTKKVLVINGQRYVAYCLDPGLKLSAGDKYNCAPLSDPGALSIISQNNEYSITQMALRFYAVFKGYGSSDLTNMKAAMIRYAQTRDGMRLDEACAIAKAEGLINHNCSSNPSDYLYGNEGTIETGYQLAWSAREQTRSTQTASGGLTFTKTAASTKDQITYKVTSLQTLNKVKFVCDGCTIVGSDKNFSGRSGTLVVRPPADCDSFKVKAYYVPQGVQLCSNVNTAMANTRQYLIVNFDEDAAGAGAGGGGSVVAAGGAGGDIDTSGEPNDMFTDRGIDCLEDCCTQTELEPNHIEGDINNCCLDNTHSEAKEYDLNQLVCFSEEFQVNHYWQMCNSENYLDKKMNGELNEYCDVFCTERITVDIPGAITATSGRYFDLTTTSQGTKSPYIEGFKRCRMLIHFKKWQDDYRKEVEEQVKQYNIYQKNKIYELMYQDAIDQKKDCNLHIIVDCQGTRDDSGLIQCEDDQGRPTGKCHVIADSTAATQKFDQNKDYTQYQFLGAEHRNKPWHEVKLDEAGFKASAEGYYNYYKILYDKTDYARHANDYEYFYVADLIADARAFEADMYSKAESKSGSCCSADAPVTCTFDFIDSCGNSEGPLSSNTEDVETVHASYNDAAEAAKGAYGAAVSSAKTLEKYLEECDTYFTEGLGTDAPSNFPFFASFFGFEYTQIYLTDFGDLKKDVTVVPFESAPGCETTGPILGPDDEDGMVEPQYSSKYYSDKITETEDFGDRDIDWEESSSGFEGYIDELYEADQRFVQDAKYKATCSWNEPENTKYTLVQKGVVQESDINITRNNRQYQVYLATLEGEYDTRWLLSGLGTNSKFDAYFAENGEVCSGRQSAMTDGLFHCVLRVDYEIISTGKCNGVRSTTETDECEIHSGTETVLNFKVVDPAVVFTCNSTSECGYGYNWFDMPGGPEALSDIRRKGSNVTNYAPENMTYQITLTSRDMREIKNYNRWRENNNYGGYSDFSLLCDCPDSSEECNEVAGTQTCKRSESCSMCRSTFMNQIYEGSLSFGGSHSISRATGSIESVRSSGHVHWTG